MKRKLISAHPRLIKRKKNSIREELLNLVPARSSPSVIVDPHIKFFQDLENRHYQLEGLSSLDYLIKEVLSTRSIRFEIRKGEIFFSGILNRMNHELWNKYLFENSPDKHFLSWSRLCNFYEHSCTEKERSDIRNSIQETFLYIQNVLAKKVSEEFDQEFDEILCFSWFQMNFKNKTVFINEPKEKVYYAAKVHDDGRHVDVLNGYATIEHTYLHRERRPMLGVRVKGSHIISEITLPNGLKLPTYHEMMLEFIKNEPKVLSMLSLLDQYLPRVLSVIIHQYLPVIPAEMK